MERLTNKREADAQRKDYENRIKNGYPRNIPEERFLRLAAYEDTKMPPELVEKVAKFAMWVNENGLAQCWGGQTVFCNPPYGRAIKDWVKKCSEESLKPNTTVVMLIPARTDTSYFHDYIYQKPNVEIRFIRGRLKFGDGKNSAPFPSMVVIFKSKKDGT